MTAQRKHEKTFTVASLHVKVAKVVNFMPILQIMQIEINKLRGIRGLGSTESLFLRFLSLLVS
jgi:hypothetical protein